jgi:F-type H+-transporting ATPase subunit a
VSPSAKLSIAAAALVVVGLGIAGLYNGAIGAAFFGTHELLSVPQVELAAPEVFRIGGLGITNTILSSWVTSVILILLLVGGMRGGKLVPSGLQNFVEWIMETLYGFVEGVAGEEYGRQFFPLISTIFLFVSFNAWMALLPIYQSLGFIHGGHIEVHLLRSAGTDLNMPLAVALISGVFVEYWGFRAHGLQYIEEFVRFRQLVGGLRKLSLLDIFSGFVDAAVGVLELLSHFIRVVSFTFRLFGNMTAGEIVLVVVAFLVSFVLAVPFYGLEVLVGFIQALIFAGLSLAFVTVAVASHGEET